MTTTPAKPRTYKQRIAVLEREVKLLRKQIAATDRCVQYLADDISAHRIDPLSMT